MRYKGMHLSYRYMHSHSPYLFCSYNWLLHLQTQPTASRKHSQNFRWAENRYFSCQKSQTTYHSGCLYSIYTMLGLKSSRDDLKDKGEPYRLHPNTMPLALRDLRDPLGVLKSWLQFLGLQRQYGAAYLAVGLGSYAHASLQGFSPKLWSWQ